MVEERRKGVFGQVYFAALGIGAVDRQDDGNLQQPANHMFCEHQQRHSLCVGMTRLYSVAWLAPL